MVTLKENQRLVCAGQMPLRTPGGKQFDTVPVYKIVPAEDVGTDPAVELLPNERLVLAGSEISKTAAEGRYNALIAGETPPESHATPLYIKEPAENVDPATGLTEGAEQALDLLADAFLSAFMRERGKI